MAETFTAEGRNGQVTFDGKTVTITREGMAGRLTHGRGAKMIPLRQISAIQIKPVSLLTTGFIQFTVPGEISQNQGKGRRTFDATKDENSVVFLKKQQTAFEELGKAVQAAIANL